MTPEKNAQGYYYYHEFYAQGEMGQGTPEFEKFLEDRKIGEIIVDRPILIDTEIQVMASFASIECFHCQ